MKATINPFTEAILNLLDEFILWIDESGHIMDANQSVSHALGYTVEEIGELTIFEVNPHLNLMDWKKGWNKLSDQPSPIRATEFLSKTEELIPVNWRSFLITVKNSSYCCMIGTSTKNQGQLAPKILGKAEIKKLHLSRFTLDISKDIVLWVRPDATIEYVNNAVYPLLGYTPEETLELHIYDFDPSYNESTFQQSWENLKSHKGSIFETQLKHKNGELIPCEVSTNYLEYEGKEYNCAFVHDLRPQKKRTAELEEAMQRISQLSEQLEIENTSLKEEIAQQYSFNDIITRSERYQQVLQRVGQVAQTEATVLLVGETGTGKELLARAIHQKSRRKNKPMIKVNCAALPQDLVESELFGHEKGAFTSAFEQKKGRFELADGGTLFLDEIGELPLELQPKLLRVLQEGVFERVGGTEPIKVDVRILAATNRLLDKMVDKGTFREDLYYRLNVFPIENLPLRERKDDIPLLVNHFAKKYSSKAGKNIEKLPAAGMKRLMKYEFPGNVRELENIVERAVILSAGKVLKLGESLTVRKKSSKTGQGEFPSFEDIQRQHIIKALERTNWRITGPKGAGRLLKMNDRTLMSKMRKLGIKKESSRR